MSLALPLAGCRVPVIEDEYFIADDLNRALTDQGAQVIGPIGEMQAALQQVRQDGFEVAVLDLNLRDEMAFSVADELRRLGVAFVFATGYEQADIPARFANVNRWEKPFDQDQLVADVALGVGHDPLALVLLNREGLALHGL